MAGVGGQQLRHRADDRGERRKGGLLTQASHQLVHDFFAAVTAGELPDAMLTPDMTARTTTQGRMDKTAYQQVIRLLATMSKQPLVFTIDSITAEEDRIVAELH